MVKTILAAVAHLFFLMVVHSNAQERSEIVQIYQKALPSIVGIELDFATSIQRGNFILKGRCYGTGFFVDKNLIITTQEVVQNKLSAKCIFHNREVGVAKVVAYDPHTPLVLLKVMRPELPFLAIRPQASVGQFVIAIGNPYKSMVRVYQTACSFGVVSARYNFRRENFLLKQVIETDAAVNPGSYGGPLIDVTGQVVGVTFSGYRQRQLAGLAIPCETVLHFLKKYRKGEIPKPDEIYVMQAFPVFVGVTLKQQGKKVVVTEIASQSPAEEAKIQKQDIILKVGKAEITSPSQFKSILRNYFVGQKIFLFIKRGKRTMQIPVLLQSPFM